MHTNTPTKRLAGSPGRLQQLRDNEIDLQVELNDLTDEIESRTARIAVVLELLRDTRSEIAELNRPLLVRHA